MLCSKGHLVSGDNCKLCGEVLRAKKVPVKGIKKTSPSMAEKKDKYKKVREDFLEANPNCAVFPELKAEEVHHPKGRIGELLLDSSLWIPVSRVGHVWIHENELEAEKIGLMISRQQV